MTVGSVTVHPEGLALKGHRASRGVSGEIRFDCTIAAGRARKTRITDQGDRRMHMAMVIFAGLLLLAVFALFGRLWGHDAAGVAQAAWWFMPVWAGVALVNLWVGVSKAGYTVAQELPILAVVFLVPAAVAMLLAWQMKG